MRNISNIYKTLRSVKLGVLLIVYLTVMCILATLVPQGRAAEFYTNAFPGPLGWVIYNTGFYSYFRSIPLFMIPIGIFFVNLLLCSIHRIITRFRGKAPLRPGPDLIHVGLLLLLLCGVLVILDRAEATVTLPVGHSVELPGGYTMYLKKFEFEKYEDGRPKDWYSTLEVYRGEELVKSHVVEVNKPLIIGNISVLQLNYKIEEIMALTGEDGRMVTMNRGDGYRRGNVTVIFTGVSDENGAIIEEWQDNALKERYILNVSDVLDGYTIDEIRVFKESGLQVVQDSSFWPIIIALIIMTAGLTLTYIQKIGDNKV